MVEVVVCAGRSRASRGRGSMVHETIKSVPIDLARSMYSNVVLSGGTSLFQGAAGYAGGDTSRVLMVGAVRFGGRRPGGTAQRGNQPQAARRRQLDYQGSVGSLIRLLASYPFVAPLEPHNRHLSAWIGASVLSMAHTFNFNWISREEYLMHGLSLVHTPR